MGFITVEQLEAVADYVAITGDWMLVTATLPLYVFADTKAVDLFCWHLTRGRLN